MMLNFDDLSSPLSGNSNLPSDKSSEQTKDCKALKTTATGGKPSVLIFGNDRDVNFLLKTILEMWNYETSEAATVEQAIRNAEKKSFDLVLMDTKLAFPDSFSEMRLMKKNSCLKDLPFILLSGHIQTDVQLSALAAGAADFFIKPINLDLLEESLKARLADGDRLENTEDFR